MIEWTVDYFKNNYLKTIKIGDREYGIYRNKITDEWCLMGKGTRGNYVPLEDLIYWLNEEKAEVVEII